MTVRADDPSTIAARWAAVLGETAVNNTIVLDEGRQTVRFVPLDGGREGIASFVFSLPDVEPKTVEIAGAMFDVTD
jgi:hypothetical protein